jgi:nitrous oxidase accessory protein NosD
MFLKENDVIKLKKRGGKGMNKYPLIGKWLAVGIILLFIGTSIIPAVAQDNEKLLPTSRGNWLYVGGSGPGNYTKIQDAIDNASEGDTVFVYDDSSPYREILVIDQSITIVGENRNSTIIDGSGQRNPVVVLVIAEHVTIQNFLVIDSDPSIGVMVYADNTTISNLWVEDIQTGMIIKGRNTTSIVKNCLLRGNVIEGSNIGLYTDHAWNVTISNNLLRKFDAALVLFSSFHCTVSSNLISDSHLGLSSSLGAKNMFTRNTITSCDEGLLLEASNDEIIDNNFLNVTKPAYFYRYPWLSFMIKSEARLFPEYEFNRIFVREYWTFGSSFWKGNYWNEPRTQPYPIPGWRGDFFIKLAYFRQFPPTRLAFDFHPVQHPYDIPIILSGTF